MPARSINFFVVGNGKRIIGENFNGGREDAWVVLCAAAIAGIVTSTVTNPIWLIKTRLQLDKNVVERSGGEVERRYRNSWDCIKQVVRGEGVRGLYKGMSASYLGVSESTLQWVLYEEMKKGLVRREERVVERGRRTVWDDVVGWTGSTGAAGGAKLVAALATYPHEVFLPSLFSSIMLIQEIGSKNEIKTSPTRTRQTKIHRSNPMLQTRLERRRHGSPLRWTNASSFENGTQCGDYVWDV